jgi:hypothetical protein
MSENPYSETCYEAADNLEEVNDTFETLIDWLSEDVGMGEAEKEVYNRHQRAYIGAENFRATIYEKVKHSEIDGKPNHIVLVEEEIGKAKDLIDRYRMEKMEESV